ncbi:MAG: hypothetical protein ACI865_002659 [Flavobacteriaceae bacterium]|jgi:hypothetical protein
MKNALIMIAVLLAGQSMAQQALGEVIGNVYEPGTKIPAVDAIVVIETGATKYRARVDLDGHFRISAIPAGTYIMDIIYQQDTLKDIIVEVPMDGFYNAGDINFKTDVLVLVGATFRANDPNEIKMIDGNLPVVSMSAKEIDKSPAKFDINGMVAGMTSNVRQTADGSLVFRGARKGDMIYMIDGVKTREAGSVPGASIGRMMVYAGGLPAKYGDTLGGVVVMESKSYFDLYRAWEGDQIRKGLR